MSALAPGLTWGLGRPEDLAAQAAATERQTVAHLAAREALQAGNERARRAAERAAERRRARYNAAIEAADLAYWKARQAWEDLQAARGVES